jgi:HEAT repeats/PBS lyase HEAT-like repeat
MANRDHATTAYLAESAPLAAADAARLTDFARACKAAQRAVALYPPAHPAIVATLRRIVHVTSPANLVAPMRLTVMPDCLLLDDRSPLRPDPAVTDLASLLHSHLIGELTVHPGGDAEAWRGLLLLLARTPESIRSDGGIAHIWTTMAGRHVELREIDYAEVLRERREGQAAAWEQIIANCLQGTLFDLDEAALQELVRTVMDPEQFAELMALLESRVEGDLEAKTAALIRMLRATVDAVSKTAPNQLEAALRNMASAVGSLSPDLLLGLMSDRSHHETAEQAPPLMNAVVSRMSEGTIAKFVARDVVKEHTATDRLAVAFQTLVRGGEERQRLLTLAREDVASSPFGSTDGFDSVWDTIAEKLLTSYSDEGFVSDEYGRELSSARTQAIAVEQVSDDPPERVAAWLSSVATTSLRTLDLTLLADILRIERDDERWGDMMAPVVSLLDDLLLVGDFEAAFAFTDILVREAGGHGSSVRRQHAANAINLLVNGSMMRHVTTHLGTLDEAQFERVKAMLVSLGEVVVRPLAETLAGDERPRTRERLTSILLAFGAAGQRTVERLKSSPNAAVRRTAIYLMRQFGGHEALPDLSELLNDNEQGVQREAVRAILNIGNEAAYRILAKALASGSVQSREAIMQSLGLVRDERVTPLFAYILQHMKRRGPLGDVYLRAIDSLGALRDPEGIAPLKDALYKGEWWAPRRTAAVRSAVATALARIGTDEAFQVLEEAAASRKRGIRNAVKPHLERGRARRRPLTGREA